VVILLCLLHIKPWTIAIAIGAVALAYYLERIGMTPPGALRALRSYFAGRYRPALAWHKVRFPVDYQRRRLPWERPAPSGEILLEPVSKSDALGGRQAINSADSA